MHFLQSPAWQSFQESLGRQTFRQSGDGWEYLAILERGAGNARLYCPFGPVANTPEAFSLAISDLTALGKKLGVTFLRVGPITPENEPIMAAHRWHIATYTHLQPRHTSIIDLSQSEDELIANMAQPVRNCYRNYRKKGVEIHYSNDPKQIDLFLNLIHQVAQRTGMTPHPDEYFKKQAEVLLPINAASFWYATYEEKNIATALFFDNADCRIYAHAAADSNYRKLNAGTALLSEAIIDAKRKGLNHVDLYGIAPEGASTSHPWYGFTKFKRSVGGHDVPSGETWELPLKPLRYWLYRLYQTIR